MYNDPKMTSKSPSAILRDHASTARPVDLEFSNHLDALADAVEDLEDTAKEIESVRDEYSKLEDEMAELRLELESVADERNTAKVELEEADGQLLAIENIIKEGVKKNKRPEDMAIVGSRYIAVTAREQVESELHKDGIIEDPDVDGGLLG